MNWRDKTKVFFMVGHFCSETDIESDRFTLKIGMVFYTFPIRRPNEDYALQLANWANEVKGLAHTEPWSSEVADTQYVLECQNGTDSGDPIPEPRFKTAVGIMMSTFEVSLSAMSMSGS